MSRKKNRRLEEESNEIDLTPMLDVVFIMLIFFIVTASFVKEAGIEVVQPPNQDQPPPDEENATILINLNANNEIWLEGRRIDVRSVRANIARLHAESPEAPVVVVASPKASTKTFVAIADASREANVFDVSLVPGEQ